MGLKDGLSSTKKDAEKINSLIDQIQQKLKDTKVGQIDPDGELPAYVDNLEKINSLSSKLQNHQKLIAKYGKTSKGYSSERLKNLAKETKQRKQNLITLQKSTKANIEAAKTELHMLKGIKNSKKERKELNRQLKQHRLVQKSINSSIKEAANLQDKFNKEARKAKRIEDIKKGFESVKSTVKSLPNPLGDVLNLTQMFGKMLMLPVTSAIELDKELGEAAKSMNQTYEAAAKSRLAMVDVAQASGELLINATHIQKTFLALNKSMGLNVEFEKLGKELQKDIGYMAMLENFAGLTAEESNSILKLSLLNGKSAKQTAGTLMATYRIESLKHGLVVNQKDALREISQVSAAIKISTDGGAEGLAKALAAAKGLGTSLKEVEGTASSLLNFEQSIEKELAAELLTGKQLNLEKARQAALNNDLATVAEEIKNQVGSEAEFAAMNRISQESLAAAVGMNRDQLAEALMTQEEGKALSEGAIDAETAKYNQMVAQHGVQGAMLEMSKQQLKVQFKQASTQEKLNAGMLKQKDAITKEIIPGMVDLNGQMEALFKKFDDILKKLGGWKSIIMVIIGLFAVNLVSSIGKIIIGLGSAIGKMVTLVGQAIAYAAAWAIAHPVTAAVGLMLAAPIAGTIAALMMDDGVVSPSSGGSGYGSRVLLGPEGAIAFNNKDTIVAGTNLFQANDAAFAGEGQMSLGSNSNNMKEIRDAIMAVASRPINVMVDGVRIIEATSEANPNEDGRASAVNSYKLQ